MRLTVKQPSPFWAVPVVSDYLSEQVAPSTTTVLEDSYSISRAEGGEFAESKLFSFELLHGDEDYDYTLTLASSDENVATVNGGGTVYVVSTGECDITVAIQGADGVTATHVVPIQVSLDTALDVDYIDYQSGTLGNTIDTESDVVMNNAATISDISRFSSRNNNTLIYNRNENFYLKGKTGLSAMSVWNSRSGNKRGAVAITPRHVIYAAHYPLQAGDVLGFAEDTSGDSALIQRNITHAEVDPNWNWNGVVYDLGVAVLDSDLPSTITPINILPSDYEDYCGQYGLLGATTFSFNQYEQASPTKIALLSKNVNNEPKHSLGKLNGKNFLTQPPVYNPSLLDYVTSSDRLSTSSLSESDKMWELHVPTIVGDSGRSKVVLLNGELVLTSLHTTPIGGFSLSNHLDRINQLISDVDSAAGLSTGYTVTEADLSSFPSY